MNNCTLYVYFYLKITCKCIKICTYIDVDVFILHTVGPGLSYVSFFFINLTIFLSSLRRLLLTVLPDLGNLTDLDTERICNGLVVML